MKDQLTIDHINLTAKNLKESVKWYQNVFGFEPVESGKYFGKDWTILKNNQVMICITEYANRKPVDEDPTAEDYHRINHYGLKIQDKEAWERLLRTNKLPTYHDSPVRYPHSTSWYVKDPAGHTIEVAHWNNNRITF